jgi:UDP-N-acetylmuramate dehydrogenase
MDMSDANKLMRDTPTAPAKLRGVLRLREPMSRHTSWRAGGCADRFYIPADLQDLSSFLQQTPKDEPVLLVGLGSNLLVRDAGVRGTVVLTHGALKQIELIGEHEPRDIYAEAGVACPKVARYAATHDLQGGEFLAGIPGTVGGALAMNAGCYGAETWERVSRVLMLGRDGQLHTRTANEFSVAYRSVSYPNEEFFAAAWLRFEAGERQRSLEMIRELLTRRIAAQPLGEPNAGSVFRNPAGEFAARLIEACGLKGRSIGAAQVSPKHANFIVNRGGARAADIEALIGLIQSEVRARHGVRLECEVRIIGETT